MFNDVDGKIRLLLEYAGISRNISDPWYTGDFEKTEEDILIGLSGLKKKIKEKFGVLGDCEKQFPFFFSKGCTFLCNLLPILHY